MRCLLCDSENTARLNVPPGLGSITSDLVACDKPIQIVICNACGHLQRNVTDEWRADAAALYNGDYNSGQHRRATFLLSELKINGPGWLNAQRGRLLDVGCGGGSLIGKAGVLLPGWELYAYDINDQQRERILGMRGVRGFYTGELDAITDSFDVITLIHVLEHVERPVPFLRQLCHKLFDRRGIVFIQTPTFYHNPFDLLVYDHAHHFTYSSLSYIARAAGFTNEPQEWIPREWSLLLWNDGKMQRSEPISPASFRLMAERRLRWLRRVQEDARALAADTNFGVLGTGTAGAWLGSVLGERLNFYVDDDPAKWGTTFMGKVILKPNAVARDALVYIPYTQPERLKRYPYIRTIVPPFL